MDKISGAIIDLNVPNYLLLNKNIGLIQKKIDETFLELRKFLGKLENTAELNKETVIKEISKVLQCPENRIKRSYDSFHLSFRNKEVEIQKKMDEFILSKEKNTYLFTDSNCEMFWNKYFYCQNSCLWFDFWLAFRCEFLDGWLTESQIEKTMEKTRQKVDFWYSAVVLPKLCNDFFEQFGRNFNHRLFFCWLFSMECL